MNRHIASVGQNQGVDDDVMDLSNPDNAEDIGPKLASEEEREAFLARFPSSWDDNRIRRTILIGWRDRLYPARDAVNWLIICGFIKPARRASLDLWLENYAMDYIRSERHPEAPAGGIPSASSSEPFELMENHNV